MNTQTSPFSPGPGRPPLNRNLYRNTHAGVASRAQYQMAQQMQQNQIVTPQKLQELVKQIDDTEQLDPDVASVSNNSMRHFTL